MRARAVNPRQPHEMTRAELAWSNYDWFVKGFINRRYEGYTLRLGENRITPDFSGVDVRTGQLCLFEVKPSDHPAAFTPVARLRLKTAASEFAELRFYVCWPLKGTKMRKWHVEEVGNRSTRLPDKVGQTNFLES